MSRKRAKRRTDVPRLDLYVLLDRTGSMESHWTETIMAVNAYVQKTLNNFEFAARATVTVFDSPDGYPVIETIRPWAWDSQWKQINPDECPPRGMTPLNDALGQALTDILKLRRSPDGERNVRTTLLVMTDGMENASRKFNLPEVRTLVGQVNALTNCSVVFLGADIDAIKVGGQYGVAYGSTMTYGKHNTVGVMDEMTRSTAAFAATGQSVNFTDTVRAAAVAPSVKAKVKKTGK